SLWLSYSTAAGGGAWATRFGRTAVITLPLFFAGIAFSTELVRSTSVAVALSSNLLGAMVGGCLEYNAMYFGYRSLYVLALVIYAAALVSSLWGGKRTGAAIPVAAENAKPPAAATAA
ncbi:MAG TPA: hypothetical protein VFB66_08780, partial [Tepidisphaeraceae bacterium]|nr:hypothetical protein [Tepidisphaeraceae bacterium]